MIDPVWKNDSKNWTFFVSFFSNDSKDWTLCKWLIQLSLFYEPLLNKSWTFVFIWLKELNLLSILLKDFEYFSKIWTLFEYDWTIEIFGWKIVKKLNSFQRIMTQRIELFFWFDSKKWNLKKWLKELNWFFLIWLTELNLFFFHLYDS